jgi:hypothetical protein
MDGRSKARDLAAAAVVVAAFVLGGLWWDERTTTHQLRADLTSAKAARTKAREDLRRGNDRLAHATARQEDLLDALETAQEDQKHTQDELDHAQVEIAGLEAEVRFQMGQTVGDYDGDGRPDRPLYTLTVADDGCTVTRDPVANVDGNLSWSLVSVDGAQTLEPVVDGQGTFRPSHPDGYNAVIVEGRVEVSNAVLIDC